MAWYDPTTWFGKSTTWISDPSTVVAAGPYRELVFLRNDPYDALELVEYALIAGFRLVQFHQIAAIQGYEEYINYHGYVTADVTSHPLSDLIESIGPGAGIISQDAVGSLDQIKLSAIWSADLATTGGSKKIFGEGTKASKKLLEDLSKHVPGLAEKAAEEARAAFWRSIPWVPIVTISGLGVATLIYFARKKKGRG